MKSETKLIRVTKKNMAALAKSAKKNSRSMTAEINVILESYFVQRKKNELPDGAGGTGAAQFIASGY